MSEIMSKYNYKWTLKDANFTKDKGKVFSCFSCGGGSTMGYKLAGFDVIGCNEIDPKMMEVYKKNHNPKYSYLEPIQEFKNRKDLPKELYNLDILDGSPPCSSFSICGNREKDWGKEKKFREGQSKQILDTLFFDFIDLAKELQSKIVIAENVKGILLGNAIEYVKKIYDEFDKAGYYCQHFLLDASTMGVPQKRERVFFICLRKDLANKFLYNYSLFEQKPLLELVFKEPEVVFGEVFKDYTDKPISKGTIEYWNNRQYGDLDFSAALGRMGKNENSFFSRKYLYMDKVANTVTANDVCVLYDYPRFRNDKELMLCGSYPLDYNFCKSNVRYLVGMSVPPLMIANIADEVYKQWLTKIK